MFSAKNPNGFPNFWIISTFKTLKSDHFNSSEAYLEQNERNCLQNRKTNFHFQWYWCANKSTHWILKKTKTVAWEWDINDCTGGFVGRYLHSTYNVYITSLLPSSEVGEAVGWTTSLALYITEWNSGPCWGWSESVLSSRHVFTNFSNTNLRIFSPIFLSLKRKEICYLVKKGIFSKFWAQWYFVTKIVLTYCKKRLL